MLEVFHVINPALSGISEGNTQKWHPLNVMHHYLLVVLHTEGAICVAQLLHADDERMDT